MSKEELTRLLFFNKNDKSWVRKLVVLLVIWYFIGIFFFFIFGISGELSSIISAFFLIGWFFLTILLFKSFHKTEFMQKHFIWLYLVGVFALATVEETIIYYNGGGLQGATTSLYHDLAMSLPVFMGIAFGIWTLDIKRKLNPGEIYIIAWIQGFLIEFFFTGMIGFFAMLGGAGAGIYGMMMTAFSRFHEGNEKSTKRVILDIIMGTILCFILVLLGAIVADIIYNGPN